MDELGDPMYQPKVGGHAVYEPPSVEVVDTHM